MSQSLTVYSPESVSGISVIGTAISKAGVVRGCDTPEKGMMFAMAAASRGVDILSLAQRYELVNGQLSMPAKVQLAEFRRRGGKHRKIERTPDAAEIELTYDGESQRFRVTWEELRKECTPYNGKESETLRMIAADNQKLLSERLKPKYATPRSRMQMLWARLVTDSIGCVMPEVTDGVYSPEETEDFTESYRDEGRSASLPAADGGGDNSRPSASTGDVEDAEFTPVDEPVKADAGQMKRIMELFESLNIDSTQQMKAFHSVGANSMADVTVAGAVQIIERMEAALNSQSPSPPAVSESARVNDIWDPASADQVEVIKGLIESVSQREGMAGIAMRVKEHINKNGIAKLGELSALSAQSLIDSLNGTTGLDDFFDVPPKRAVAG